jgi:hypothetical protein
LYQFGYGHKSGAEYFLFMYDFSTLNQNKVDFKSAATLKGLANKVSTSETGDSVKFKDEDLRRGNTVIDTVTNSTTFVLTVAVDEGQELYNRNTLKTYAVIGVAGTTITIDAADAAAQAGDVLVLGRFGKKYAQDDSQQIGRNDTVEYENFVHFGEYSHDFIARELNKNRVFMQSPADYVLSRVGDMARAAIFGKVASVYTGIKLKYVNGGITRYYSGGLDHFIPQGFKANIYGSTDAKTKQNILDQIALAYQSGIPTSSFMLACNQKMKSLINRFWYDKHLVINDKLESINLDIQTYDVDGYSLRLFHSNTLETLNNSVPLAYLIPMDNLFMFNLPNITITGDAKLVANADMMTYLKPQSTMEKATLALMSSHSTVFQGISSGAFQRWTYLPN